jgi:hypothetical protein
MSQAARDAAAWVAEAGPDEAADSGGATRAAGRDDGAGRNESVMLSISWPG